jgi:hypothetical protein
LHDGVRLDPACVSICAKSSVVQSGYAFFHYRKLFFFVHGAAACPYRRVSWRHAIPWATPSELE